MFVGRKLWVTLAFTGLMALAFGVSCRGFFVKPTLTSITISPTAPAVQVGTSATLQAFGVFNDGSSQYLTTNVSWSSSEPSIATVSGTGSATIDALTVGTASITAASQAVTSTATATVFISISAIGLYPTSFSLPETSITGQSLEVYANNDQGLTNPNDDLSPTATIAVYQAGTTTPADGVTCAYPGTGTTQLCTTSDALPGTYTAVASYSGSTLTASATITITNSP
jgi:Bacterial Ig-like domain (group 2)